MSWLSALLSHDKMHTPDCDAACASVLTQAMFTEDLKSRAVMISTPEEITQGTCVLFIFFFFLSLIRVSEFLGATISANGEQETEELIERASSLLLTHRHLVICHHDIDFVTGTYFTVVSNAGGDRALVLGKLLEQDDLNLGYDEAKICAY
ncbi:unnamed protein product [Fraxinus pennsylvanica]|uniref:Uncharacterized protein n=1 Tax=Fraxinus pennsylvanica TaxID=56036 RepID=A0AAD1ZDX8_9LAMI|nr:unnamed protein product [Fraxinus pennsylvanica]